MALREGVVADVDAVARVVEAAGAEKGRVGAIVRALTPFAATLGADGVPKHRVDAADMPTGSGASFWTRLASLIK